jgi:hypothetical protein
MLNKEICICAAVLASDGKYYRGHRHSECIQAITARGLICNKDSRLNQGFITSENRFVDRYIGAKLQNEAGIVSVVTGQPIDEILFSEDLY